MKRVFVILLAYLTIVSNGFAFNVDIGFEKIVRNGYKLGEVMINNKIVMRLYDEVDGVGPYLRAEKIAQRLTQFVALGLDPEEIRTIFINGKFYGVIGNRTIFAVGKLDAQINQSTEDVLANEWIISIRQAFKGMNVSKYKLPNDQPVINENKSYLLAAGIASWYASDTDEFEAVHPSLPIGTRVRVRNLANGWTVVVKIVSNEPLPNGRVINVSKSPARALGLIQSGIGKVKISRVY